MAYYTITTTTFTTGIVEAISPSPLPTSSSLSSPSQSGWIYATAVLATVLGVSIFLLLIIFGYVKPKRWKKAGAAEKERELEELVAAGRQRLKEDEHEVEQKSIHPKKEEGERERETDRGRYTFLGNNMGVPPRMPMAAPMPMGGPGVPWGYW